MATTFHQYSNGMHTASKGMTVDAVRVSDLDETPGAAVFCTIAEDCKSGLVSTVLHGATGIYTFQLSKPYPPKLVVCMPQIDAAATTSDILTARYDSGTYNATTGQFIINVSNDDDSGAPVAADGGATDELHVLLICNRYSR